MPSIEELAPVADASAFIFTGSIARAGASTMPVLPVDAATVVVSVRDVIKAPLGLRGLAGREVTMQLLHPLSAGHYVFFADLWSVGEGLAVKERAHLDARAGAEATAAMERGYATRIERRVRTASLVVLGRVGAVRPLLAPAERRNRMPWALASLEIERVLKGKGKPHHAPLVGPLHGSKKLPNAPALRTGLHAILILHRPPPEAVEHIPQEERQTALFVAETSDIQPPERLAAIVQILSAAE